MPDYSTLVTVAGIIGGFGATVLVFRVQRETSMEAKSETTWVPWADWLIVAASLLSLSLGVFPVVSGLVQPPIALRLGMASTSCSVVLLFGYIFAILAHYRLVLGGGRVGPRANPEPAERWIVWSTAVVAAGVFVVVGCGTLG